MLLQLLGLVTKKRVALAKLLISEQVVAVGKVEFTGQVIRSPLLFRLTVDRLPVDGGEPRPDDGIELCFCTDNIGEIPALRGLDVQKISIRQIRRIGLYKGGLQVLFDEVDGKNDGQGGGESDNNGARGVFRPE